MPQIPDDVKLIGDFENKKEVYQQIVIAGTHIISLKHYFKMNGYEKEYVALDKALQDMLSVLCQDKNEAAQNILDALRAKKED